MKVVIRVYGVSYKFPELIPELDVQCTQIPWLCSKSELQEKMYSQNMSPLTLFTPTQFAIAY